MFPESGNETEVPIIHSGSKVKSKSSMLMENKGKSNNQKQKLLLALINISRS